MRADTSGRFATADNGATGSVQVQTTTRHRQRSATTPTLATVPDQTT
jgi:hypothetical protein